MWNILIVNCVTKTCIWNTCVNWQAIDYKHPEDDTIVSKHVGVTICEIFVHLLVIVQNNKTCQVHVLKEGYNNIYYVNLHKTCVKHLNCKLCYQKLHLKYLCKFASYWLQAPWGWHDSVETYMSVIICEIIVHLLVMIQNNERCMVHVLK